MAEITRKEMNCRERALRAIRFENPDKIPLSYSVIPPALFKYGQRFIDLCKMDMAAIRKICDGKLS